MVIKQFFKVKINDLDFLLCHKTLNAEVCAVGVRCLSGFIVSASLGLTVWRLAVSFSGFLMSVLDTKAGTFHTSETLMVTFLQVIFLVIGTLDILLCMIACSNTNTTG